jgi:hypothetical protein
MQCGRIAVSWQKQKDSTLLYEVTIPANTTAELILPKSSPWKSSVTEIERKTLQPSTHRFEIK